MKKILAALALVLAASAAQAQTTYYNLFGPANGILVGSTSSPATTAATSSNITGLFSGTCSSTTYLSGSGACSTPAGTGITFAAPSVFSVSGSPGTSITLSFASGQTQNEVLASPNGSSGAVSLRALVAADLPSISSGLSGTLPASNGGTGEAGTITGILYGNGTSAHTAATSTNVIGLFSGTCSSTTYLSGSGACSTPAGTGTGANPTANVSTSAVNGVATTYMRSDAAPAIDQTMSPTWTGSHTWSSGFEVLNATSTNTAGYAYTQYKNTNNDTVNIGVNGPSSSAFMTNGPTGEQGFITTSQINMPLAFGTAGNLRCEMVGNTATATNSFQCWGSTANALVDASPDTGTVTATLVGCTTSPTSTNSWVRVGNIVTLTINRAGTGTCTSNSSGFSETSGIVGEIEPASQQCGVVPFMEDSGATTYGSYCVNPGNTGITFYKQSGTSGSTWTTTGTKGLNGNSTVTYQLN